jgi:phosphohistidine swiveling domain-containing protein
MSLNPLPDAPAGVRYALTVPQSVLFADLSLRGSRKGAIREVFGTKYEMSYVAIDDGAMSWDFTGDEAFASALLDSTDPAVAVRRFVAGMGATARAVEKVSRLLGSSAIRRGSAADLLADLRQYWRVYELHMTSLFTFWNVEDLLSKALTDGLREAGLEAEIGAGLERFLQPSETNYFALERRLLARLASRFGTADEDDPARQTALAAHVAEFGFLLAPFNLGSPPSAASLEERVKEGAVAPLDGSGPLIDGRPDNLANLPEPVRDLGLLAQELTFWKTERLDVLALADSRAGDLYRAVADCLAIDVEHLFAMRREEIEDSLAANEVRVAHDELEARLKGYCLLLHGGRIGFYEPSHASEAAADTGGAVVDDEIRGMAASAGVVSGTVRLVYGLDDVPSLQAGDVLVTAMTRPEMGVALDRAAAFVTDQGGLMAHAAIIAREMGKPCVIGTEVATRVLRDGMTVTVDGDSGIVRIEGQVD